MKAITNSVLAAAVLLALPFASEACSIAAWNGNTSASTGAVASGPAGSPAQSRYSDSCSLQAGAGVFVTDNTPTNEATFRMQVYVQLTGTGKFFSATTGDGATGTEVFGLSYSGGNITVSGATGTTPIPAVAGAWYSVQAAKQSDGSFSLTVQGNGAAAPTTTSGTGVTGNVGSASVGLIGTGTNFFRADSYTSTRSASTPIPRLCRGDTNGDGVRNIQDAGRINLEFQNPVLRATTGQPDYNENGVVNIQDAGQVQALFLGGPAVAACPSS